MIETGKTLFDVKPQSNGQISLKVAGISRVKDAMELHDALIVLSKWDRSLRDVKALKDSLFNMDRRQLDLDALVLLTAESSNARKVLSAEASKKVADDFANKDIGTWEEPASRSPLGERIAGAIAGARAAISASRSSSSSQARALPGSPNAIRSAARSASQGLRWLPHGGLVRPAPPPLVVEDAAEVAKYRRLEPFAFGVVNGLQDSFAGGHDDDPACIIAREHQEEDVMLFNRMRDKYSGIGIYRGEECARRRVAFGAVGEVQDVEPLVMDLVLPLEPGTSSGRSVLLCGLAGSGKTVLSRELLKRACVRFGPENVIACGLTGSAAELHQGSTLHAVCAIRSSGTPASSVFNGLTKMQRQTLEGVQFMLIEEVSMGNMKVMQLAFEVLAAAKGGWEQLRKCTFVLVGDYAQLPSPGDTAARIGEDDHGIVIDLLGGRRMITSGA